TIRSTLTVFQNQCRILICALGKVCKLSASMLLVESGRICQQSLPSPKRKSEPEILAAMVKDEPQIRLARRRGTIYEPAEGPYRRVLKAFSILPEHIRLELLFGPRGV
ncbi:MAG: hypothetical protein ACOH5I_26525, partial [Oligoflexus sp.]